MMDSIEVVRQLQRLPDVPWRLRLPLPALLAYARLLEWRLVPGIFEHQANRKKAISDVVKSSQRQLVVYGAGFDSLAAHIAGAIATDEPPTAAVRARLWPTEDTRARDLLTNSILLVAKPAIHLFEGVLMYIPWKRVKQLFEDVPAGHQIIFSFMCRDGFASQKPRTQRRLKPPFQWHLSEEDMARELSGIGYSVERIWPSASLAGNGEAYGESMMLAVRK